MISFVVLVNMYCKNMELQVYQIFGYLALGVTASYGGAVSLFLVRFYYTGSSTPFVSKLSVGQMITQVISSSLACVVVVYLHYHSSLVQVKVTLIPLIITIFVLPFTTMSLTDKESNNIRNNILCFLTFLGLFMMLHHIYMTWMLYMEWLNLRIMVMVTFNYECQYKISVDLICCIVVTTLFAVVELYELSIISMYNVLPSFLFVVVISVLISPGAFLLLFVAYRERKSSKYSQVTQLENHY